MKWEQEESLSFKKTFFVVIGIAGLFVYLLDGPSLLSSQDRSDEFYLSYSAPRPPSYQRDLDLSGRDIRRRLIERKTDGHKTTATPSDPQSPQAQVNPEGQEIPQAPPSPPRPPQRPIHSPTTETSTVRVHTVPQDRRQAINSRGEQDSQRRALSQQNTTSNEVLNEGSPPSPGRPQENATPRSIEEWRDLLRTQLSPALISRLVEDYQNEQLSPTSFYLLVDEMLSQVDEEAQRMGVLALSLTPSITSFDLLARFSLSEQKLVSDEVIDKALLAYSEPGSLFILEQILRESSSHILALALDLLIYSIRENQLTSDQVALGVRSTRANEEVAPPNLYHRFLPRLGSLLESEDQEVSQLAQTALFELHELTQGHDLAQID